MLDAINDKSTAPSLQIGRPRRILAQLCSAPCARQRRTHLSAWRLMPADAASEMTAMSLVPSRNRVRSCTLMVSSVAPASQPLALRASHRTPGRSVRRTSRPFRPAQTRAAGLAPPVSSRQCCCGHGRTKHGICMVGEAWKLTEPSSWSSRGQATAPELIPGEGTCHLGDGRRAAEQVYERVQRVVGQLHGRDRLQDLVLALLCVLEVPQHLLLLDRPELCLRTSRTPPGWSGCARSTVQPFALLCSCCVHAAGHTQACRFLGHLLTWAAAVTASAALLTPSGCECCMLPCKWPLSCFACAALAPLSASAAAAAAAAATAAADCREQQIARKSALHDRTSSTNTKCMCHTMAAL
jgi:hypothetical protein